MLAQAVDFQAEADELQTLLATLGASDWERATLFKGWTVNDIVQHLHDGDLMAAASVAGPEFFSPRRPSTPSGSRNVDALWHSRTNMEAVVAAATRSAWRSAKGRYPATSR